MSGETQTWKRYALSPTNVDQWPKGLEDLRKKIFALIEDHPLGDGPLTVRLVGPDDEALQTITQNIAVRFAETTGNDATALVDVDLADLDLDTAHFSKDERDKVLQHRIEDKQQQLGDAMLASRAGPTVVSLQHVDAVPGKWQASFFSVLDEHYCNVPDGPGRLEGDPDNLIVVSTMRDSEPRHDLDLKFRRLMGATFVLDEDA